MPALPRVTAADFPEPSVSPLTISQIFMQSYQQGQEMARQRRLNAMREEEFAMRRADWQQQQESRQWEAENIRPLKLLQERARLGQIEAMAARAKAQTINKAVAQHTGTVQDQAWTNAIGRFGQEFIGAQSAGDPTTMPAQTDPRDLGPNPPLDSLTPAPPSGSLLPPPPASGPGGTRAADAAGAALPDGRAAPSAAPSAAPAPRDYSKVFAALDEVERQAQLTHPQSRERYERAATLEAIKQQVMADPDAAKAWEERQAAKQQAEAAKVEAAKVQELSNQLYSVASVTPGLVFPPTVTMRDGQWFVLGKPATSTQLEAVKQYLANPPKATAPSGTRPSITPPELRAIAGDDSLPQQTRQAAQAQLDQLLGIQPPPVAKQPAAAPGGAAPPSSSPPPRKPTLNDLPEFQSQASRQQSDKNRAWTQAKAALTKDLPEELLLAAANTTGKVETGRVIQPPPNMPFGASPASPLSAYPEQVSPARAVLLKQGYNPDETVDIAGQKVRYEDLLTAALDDLARAQGLGNHAPQKAPGPSDEVKAKAAAFRASK